MASEGSQHQVHPAQIEAIRRKVGTTDGTRWQDNITTLWEVVDAQQETINELSNQLVDLTEQVEELSAALENDSYEQLTRKQKRLKVKRLVQNAATENRGKGAVDYKEIRSAFGKQMPAGTAYNIMKQIGKEPGYEYKSHDEKNDTLRVDLDETDDDLFSRE